MDAGAIIKWNDGAKDLLTLEKQGIICKDLYAKGTLTVKDDRDRTMLVADNSVLVYYQDVQIGTDPNHRTVIKANGGFEAKGSLRILGRLDMNGNSIQNLKDPTQDSDGCTKKYVDGQFTNVKAGLFLKHQANLIPNNFSVVWKN